MTTTGRGASQPRRRRFTVHGPLTGQGATAERILRALPGWFGIETAIVDYARSADEHPTFVATAGPLIASGEPVPGAASDTGAPPEIVGFVTLLPTSECAVELHVMAVLPEWHRAGVGRALVTAAGADALADGHTLLHVKTLAASDPDTGYAATRAFYLAVGFRPLEVLPQVWGPENPCLVLVRPLA